MLGLLGEPIGAYALGALAVTGAPFLGLVTKQAMERRALRRRADADTVGMVRTMERTLFGDDGDPTHGIPHVEGLVEQVQSLKETVERELTPNHGGSMKDHVARIVAWVERQEAGDV